MQVIGRFDRKIVIQQRVSTRNSTTNAPSGTWETYITVQAQRESKKGREKVQGNQPISPADEIFTIRYNSGVTESMRVLYNDRTFEIYDVDEIRRRELLKIYCSKI